MWIKINEHRINFDHVREYYPTDINEMGKRAYILVIEYTTNRPISFTFASDVSRDNMLSKIDSITAKKSKSL